MGIILAAVATDGIVASYDEIFNIQRVVTWKPGNMMMGFCGDESEINDSYKHSSIYSLIYFMLKNQFFLAGALYSNKNIYLQ